MKAKDFERLKLEFSRYGTLTAEFARSYISDPITVQNTKQTLDTIVRIQETLSRYGQILMMATRDLHDATAQIEIMFPPDSPKNNKAPN